MKRIISVGLVTVMALSLSVVDYGNSVKEAKAVTVYEADEESDNGKVVVIDAGHQSRAMGAMEPNGPGSSTMKAKVTGGASGCSTHQAEYKLNLKVAKKLKSELVSRGYKVVMIRTTNNVRISNVERAKIANKYKADAFIRVHANSSGSSGTQGALSIAPQSNNKYMSKKIRKKSQQFSRKLIKEYCKATKAKNRGVMYTNTMTGINWCKVPVSIIEMGFLSNPREDRLMASATYQRKIVKGIANGIDSFLGI